VTSVSDRALGWNGAQALDTARARILAGVSEVALVVGADTTPKGFSRPMPASAGTAPR
jgi:3-hydroxy-3-methylglutaryl CoA synthase